MASTVLKDTIRGQIIELIITGQLKPGERIKEIELSKLFKVSRTPLREALISLERLNLIRSAPNVGFTINELSSDEVEEVYPLLCLLECYALELSFPRLQTQIKPLEKANQSLHTKRKSPHAAYVADREFHQHLIQYCKNTTVLKMIHELSLRISRYEHCYMAKSEQLEHSYEQHEKIIKAIRAGDLGAAKKALQTNWKYGTQFVLAELTKACREVPKTKKA